MKSFLRRVLLSSGANLTFLYASVITFISFLAVILSELFLSDAHVYDTNSFSQAFIFYGIVALVAIAVIAQFVLWIGMLTFTLFVSRRSTTSRLFLLVPQLIFVSLGAMFVYFKSYRPAFQDTCSS